MKFSCSSFKRVFVIISIFNVFFVNAAERVEYGVNTHFAMGKGDKSLVKEWASNGQITSLRDELKWGGVEFSPSQYEFYFDKNVLRTNNILKEVKVSNINSMAILDYGNRYYDNGGQPFSEAGLNAFAEYSGWVAKQTKDYVKFYEIWNEWNIGGGSKPKVRVGDPALYVKLAKLSYDKIKLANPQAKVVVGALGDDLKGYPWLRSAINKGLLTNADGLSVHLYNYCAGNQLGAFELTQRLLELQQLVRSSNYGKGLPLYVTEVGWPTHDGRCGVSEEVAAEQTLRFLLESRLVEDLAGIWWYEFQDSGYLQTERENRFGLVRTNNVDKPSGCRFKNIVPILSDMVLEKSIVKDKVTIMMFKNSNGKKLLSVSAGPNYIDTNRDVSISGIFEDIKPYDVKCGDRTDQSEPFTYKDNTLTLTAHSFSRLFWLGSNSSLKDFR